MTKSSSSSQSSAATSLSQDSTIPQLADELKELRGLALDLVRNASVPVALAARAVGTPLTSSNLVPPSQNLESIHSPPKNQWKRGQRHRSSKVHYPTRSLNLSGGGIIKGGGSRGGGSRGGGSRGGGSRGGGSRGGGSRSGGSSARNRTTEVGLPNICPFL
ncbi:keratin, type I cytoskeletal 10-like [Macrobrachium nipponense]|uniref:keratin, type I cytoskeletal 10-like n=1 Tax=Macrobrachium nipponense TaxID=159736 RepID=UPI0030C7C35A